MLIPTKYYFAVCCLSFAVIFPVETKKHSLPSYVKKCHINEDTLSHCLKESMDSIRTYLKKGIPEMRLPSIDPLILPMVTIKIDNFVLNATDMHIYESTMYQIKDINFSPKENVLKITMYYPFLRFAADYSVDGKLLLLSFSGNGKSDVNATDITAMVVLKGVQKKKNNLTFLDFNDNKVTLHVGSATVDFGDIVKGSEQLTAVTNKVINDNIDEFLKEFNPYVEETVGAYVFGIIRNVFNLFPMEELFIYN